VMIVNENSTVLDAIDEINKKQGEGIVVLDGNRNILGTLTDGDVRRFILSGGSIKSNIKLALNKNPVIYNQSASVDELNEALSRFDIKLIPLVDSSGKYVSCFNSREYFEKLQEKYDNVFSTAVIMAGGKGKRLQPLTNDTPKPMIEIDGVPLIERQIMKLKEIGVKKVYISVKYLKEKIINHFKDGKKFGVGISYLQEDSELGTAGALSLITDLDSEKPILLLNGDILTNVDFVHLFEFHHKNNAVITTCAVSYQVNIPYGVIHNEGIKLEFIEEKPSQSFLCNAGIYALSTQAIKKIPYNQFYNMTDLIDACQNDNDHVCVFPIHEYWSDIGTVEDLSSARRDFIYKDL